MPKAKFIVEIQGLQESEVLFPREDSTDESESHSESDDEEHSNWDDDFDTESADYPPPSRTPTPTYSLPGSPIPPPPPSQPAASASTSSSVHPSAHDKSRSVGPGIFLSPAKFTPLDEEKQMKIAEQLLARTVSCSEELRGVTNDLRKPHGIFNVSF